ncbi:MAG: mechanosensitive ion channel domain-containing protein, partial [Actinomycetota bacterium]
MILTQLVSDVIGPLARGVGKATGVFVVVLVAIAVLRRLVRRLDDVRLREQLLFFVPKLCAVCGVLVLLAVVGVDVSGMAAVLATVGFTGAVVFTSVGQNLVAGAMITIDDVYRVGEAVSVGDLHGIVVYKTMLRTELELPDGSKAWVPNAAFQDGEVLNHSRLGGWRIRVEIPLERAADRALAQEVMSTVMEHLAWNVPHRRAFVTFDHVGAEAMFFHAYAWIIDRTEEPWYRGLLLGELVDALEGVGVSVGQTTNLSLRPIDEASTTTAVVVQTEA